MSDSVSEILRKLLRAMKTEKLKHVRYYRYEDKSDVRMGSVELPEMSRQQPTGRMVSVESAGMPREIAASFRTGSIIKFGTECPLAKHDSFWCFHLKQPVIFHSDPKHNPQRMQPRQKAGHWVCRIGDDHCRSELSGVKTPLWVDVPLVVVGECVGKLSCDFVGKKLDDAMFEAVDRLNLLVKAVAPYIEACYSREWLTARIEIGQRIQSCLNLNDFLTYCTTRLSRKSFRCNNASFFTLVEDGMNIRRLVLRRTSYQQLRSEENKAFYDLTEPSLTTWVANERRPLRLQDLDNERRRCEQFAAYGGRLHWTNKWPDSACHRTFLAVPLIYENELVGVLRFTQKIGERRFSEKDQQLLQLVAADYIAPKLRSLMAARFENVFTQRLEDISRTSVVVSSAESPLPHAMKDALSNFFPEDNASRKLYLLNVLSPGGKEFRHHAVGGKLCSTACVEDEYDLEGTLTNHAIRAGGRSVLLLNLEKAEDAACYRKTCPDAVSGMACAIAFGGNAYGAVVVMSDRYDLELGYHGRLLEMVAMQAGEIFARRRLIDRASALVGMKHDIGHALGALEEMILSHAGLSPKQSRECESLFGFVHSTLHSYLRHHVDSAQAAKRFERRECVETNVAEQIRRAILGCVDARECQFDISGVAPSLMVRVCPSFLMSIIFNLLKNACTACAGTDAKPVRVCATVVNGKPAEKKQLIVTVKDYGRGMDDLKRDLYRKWDVMQEVAGAPGDTMGVGIPLAKRLARWHELSDGRHGNVRLVKSSPNEGTEFQVELPICDESQVS